MQCQWFLMCDREAVGTIAHPILGDVPVCQRCADKHDTLNGATATALVRYPEVAGA